MKHLILIVDDDQDELELFEDALGHFQENEFRCIYAPDGLQAIEILTHIIPDYIFLDVNMPGMSGIDLLFKIRNSIDLSRTKIYMHSTNMTDDIDRMAILAGASGCIKKVNTIKELINELVPVLSSGPKLLSFILSGKSGDW